MIERWFRRGPPLIFWTKTNTSTSGCHGLFDFLFSLLYPSFYNSDFLRYVLVRPPCAVICRSIERSSLIVPLFTVRDTTSLPPSFRLCFPVVFCFCILYGLTLRLPSPSRSRILSRRSRSFVSRTPLSFHVSLLSAFAITSSVSCIRTGVAHDWVWCAP